ncbi:MAG: DEAD/DEAH box helicase [Bacteroides sp.]|nr:DEAD/DEAH box helicase [Bacteroides sp.]MBD5316137.1 DEAD/DEAH box helicase [Bacteroides sp.]
MKLNLITENIRQKLGIAELNAMQKRMAQAEARSMILLAPTGSGKTLAFTIAMLRLLGKPGRGVRAVVIAPSRELVMQIADVVRPVAAGYKTVAFYGGHPMQEEVRSLSVVPDIIVATPGRLLDHINRKTVDLSEVSVLVLDEYDKSLELGFEDEMKKVTRSMRALTGVILTSATRLKEMPKWLPLAAGAEVVDFTTGVTEAAPVPKVNVESPARDKLDTLVDLLTALPVTGKAIVFVNHRDAAERIHKRLTDYGLPAGLYHGGLDQPERENAVEMLENDTTPILVSTDLGARGLDIAGVDSVIHYHLPPTAESWTHRNGRTARQGAEGTVYVITAEGEDIPEYVEWDRAWRPAEAPAVCPRRPYMATLYFNVGKKEKISRGDIAGFLIAKGGLAPDEVGRIAVRDHCALAAVPADKARQVVKTVQAEKIKGKRARITRLQAS